MDPRQFEHSVVGDNDIHSIVMSYLLHNCFNETADSLASCTGGVKQPAGDRDNIQRRKQIIHFVLEMKALKAVELTDQLAKDLLEKNKDLHFDLLRLHFVELVCARKCNEAIEFAKTILAPFGTVQKYVEKLEDAMALLAYDDPEKSPLFHLLSSEYRQQVADNLNRTILEHTNQPSYTPMERIIQHVTVVRQYLTEENGKDAFPPFALKDSLKG
ncbi:PREDICTED: glucose-induced degradation protein 8 homolog [Camelina sativa]|uniref:Glucose-induced degradation protein 8 homolog n=1 Tax=Camelina sativa TaxID=90675 RepID=A0ABM0VKT6_CAMSA|nr:PREDICTED: glucose-induced degradation protein 8 homolog [Camelina sativa]